MLKLFVISILICTQVHAQTFRTVTSAQEDSVGTLSFDINGTFFFKNNEYFNSFTKGFTGIGYFLKPSLTYQLLPKTELELGCYLLKYSGTSKVSELEPTFRIKHQLSPSAMLVVGNIYGNLNHELEEPIYRFDRFYQNNLENGFQLLIDHEKIKSDIWLNWERFIFTGDSLQEKLVAGNTNRIVLLKKDHVALTLPVQALFVHIGGQIDSSPNAATTTLNTFTGLQLTYHINSTSSVYLAPLVSHYIGIGLPEYGQPNSQHFQNGMGIYPKIGMEHKRLVFMLGYWNAKQYIAERGEYLFQSVSEFNPSFTEANRELYTAKASFQKNFDDKLKIEVRGEAYFDPINTQLDYSYGLYLVANESFFIIRNKKQRK